MSADTPPERRPPWLLAYLVLLRAVCAKTPGHVALVVLATIASQVCLLLALWLPWKLLGLLADLNGAWQLPGWTPALQADALVNALLVAIAGVFVLHLALERALVWGCTHGARTLSLALDKTGMFTQQGDWARHIYTRLVRSLASALCVLLCSQLLLALYPGLAGVLWGWTAAAGLGLLALRRVWPTAGPWLVRHRTALAGPFMHIGFFVALCLVVAQYRRGDTPALIVLVLAMILLRLSLQHVVGVVDRLFLLSQRRDQAAALFLSGHTWRGTLTAQGYEALLQTGELQRWVPQLLSELEGAAPGAKDDAAKPDAQVVRVGGGHAALVMPRSAAQPWVFKLYNRPFDAQAQREADLMALEGHRLPVPSWRGARRLQGVCCHVWQSDHPLQPVRPDQVVVMARQIRAKLMGLEPLPETVDRYRRSLPAFWERVGPQVFDQLALAASSDAQRAQVAWLRERWDSWCSEWAALPPQITLARVPVPALMLGDAADMSPLLLHWSAWEIAPVGAGWTGAPDLGRELQSAWEKARERRPALSELSTAQLLKVARSFELQRHCAAGNFAFVFQCLSRLQHCK